MLISNKLSRIVAKTQSMLVSTKAKRKALYKSKPNLQVEIHGTELDVVSKITYLEFFWTTALIGKIKSGLCLYRFLEGLGF